MSSVCLIHRNLSKSSTCRPVKDSFLHDGGLHLPSPVVTMINLILFERRSFVVLGFYCFSMQLVLKLAASSGWPNRPCNVCPSLRLSVCPHDQQHQRRAAFFCRSPAQEADIDRYSCRRCQNSAEGSVSAVIRGESRQTCFAIAYCVNSLAVCARLYSVIQRRL